MAYTTIDKPSDYFETKLYTGNGSTLNVTGLDFQPDFTWLKCRGIAYNHRLYDVIRTPLDSLQSNSTSAESADGDGLSAFNSDGFTVTQGANTEYNNSGVNYVSWNWLASNTTASNTDGTITSTVSTNQTAGFSIVKYNSSRSPSPVQTVGHGLGVKPDMLIFKNINETQNWLVWHKDIATDKHLNLNTTSALITDTGSLNNTAPTSTVFTIGADGRTNSSTNGNPIICYTFAEKKGYSKFGSYTGNGSTNGTFVYTGFKPAWVMQKKTSGISDWVIYDNKRDVSNVVTQELKPNLSNAESSFTNIDILSNGFKQRADYAYTNNSSGTYIYMAFAENPFVTSTGIPCTAR